MRRLISASLTAAALGIGFGATAFAADLPPIYKAPPAPYYNSWTGFYVGADVGYAWQDPTVTLIPNDPAASVFLNGGTTGLSSPSYNLHSPFGGLEGGYNWQFNRSWLGGVETDFNWSGLEGLGSSSSPIGGAACKFSETSTDAGSGCNRGISTDQEVLWFGTLRARAGWLATNDLLLYGTGGFAYGKVSESVIASNIGGPGAIKISQGGFSVVCGAGQTCYQGSSEFIGTGWTAGGGLEYHVPGSAASLKLEYLFVDLGSGGIVNAVAGKFLSGTSASSFGASYPEVQFNTVKLGLNWKLN